MRIIKENNHFQMQDVAKIALDTQKVWTRFFIQMDVQEGILLCHTVTGEVLLFSHDEYQYLHTADDIPLAVTNALIEHRFLVDKSNDEEHWIEEQRDRVMGKKKDDVITSFTILPTSRCNARCFYCYEQGIPQKNMSLQTARDVVDYIVQQSKGKKATLSWFGGEPTVAHPIISYISAQLQGKGIAFESGMISNGLLLDEQMIVTAKEQWHLKSVQITIDGTEEVYNQTKNYKGKNHNPYQTVLSHIDSMIAGQIHVSVRINLGLHNFEDINSLIEELAQRYAGKKYISVYVHEINNYYDDAQLDVLLSQTYELNKKLIEKQLHQPHHLPSFRSHSCMADSDDSVMINPDGQLGKCEHYAYEKLHGSIYDEKKDEDLIQKWKEKVFFIACKSCVFYPSCYYLKWCNGGVKCSAASIQVKMQEAQDAMQHVYRQWKMKCQSLRNSIFELAAHMEIQQADGQDIVVFYAKDEDETALAIPVNDSAKEILYAVEKECSFTDIVERLKQKYEVSDTQVEADIEDYLLKMLQMRVFRQQRHIEEK